MAQRAIAVFLAVGLHSGDAAVPAVAYEFRSWDKSLDCSGPPDSVERFPLEICINDKYHQYQWVFERQINDTNLGVTQYPQGGHLNESHGTCEMTQYHYPEYYTLMGCAVHPGNASSMGYFWVYSKDLAV